MFETLLAFGILILMWGCMSHQRLPFLHVYNHSLSSARNQSILHIGATPTTHNQQITSTSDLSQIKCISETSDDATSIETKQPIPPMWRRRELSILLILQGKRHFTPSLFHYFRHVGRSLVLFHSNARGSRSTRTWSTRSRACYPYISWTDDCD